jgi:hypothetical protein
MGDLGNDWNQRARAGNLTKVKTADRGPLLTIVTSEVVFVLLMIRGKFAVILPIKREPNRIFWNHPGFVNVIIPGTTLFSPRKPAEAGTPTRREALNTQVWTRRLFALRMSIPIPFDESN